MSDQIRNENLSEALQDALSDSYRLMFKTQSYHWNVTGPLFHSLHTMTEEHYTELFTAIDDIAERVRAMGFAAPASLAEILDRSSLHDREDIPQANEMARDLALSHSRIGDKFRLVAEQADDDKDGVTADLATARAEVHDKAAWMYHSLAS